jgi:hypothetical protein
MKRHIAIIGRAAVAGLALAATTSPAVTGQLVPAEGLEPTTP